MPQLDYRGELGRKALHLLALVLPLAVHLLGSKALFGLVPLAAGALFLDVARVRLAWVNTTIDRVFGWMMRPSERPPMGSPVVINGATWVLISMALLTAVFPPDIAVVAFVTFMLGDAAAALAGRRFGRTRWGREGCTVEGSAAFLIAAGAAAALLPYAYPYWMLASLVIASMLIEGAPLRLNDNLVAPFAGAVVLYALSAPM
ncbi:MAG: phosphatidate cytidylyltransferase [Bacteroidetes bacterium CG12_big_fil_rev_8_21_14_0_65_60_17]|nr:MAG: phosphatidate cytidylyltransferase [Bacteroidetes bacterium CG12_big_fil_rev_8_21_14_0_65_60_17]